MGRSSGGAPPRSSSLGAASSSKPARASPGPAAPSAARAIPASQASSGARHSSDSAPLRGSNGNPPTRGSALRSVPSEKCRSSRGGPSSPPISAQPHGIRPPAGRPNGPDQPPGVPQRPHGAGRLPRRTVRAVGLGVAALDRGGRPERGQQPLQPVVAGPALGLHVELVEAAGPGGFGDDRGSAHRASLPAVRPRPPQGVRVHTGARKRCANADCGPGAAAGRLVGAAAPAPAGPGTALRPPVSRPFRGGHPWTPRSAPRRTPRSSPTSRR